MASVPSAIKPTLPLIKPLPSLSTARKASKKVVFFAVLDGVNSPSADKELFSMCSLNILAFFRPSGVNSYFFASFNLTKPFSISFFISSSGEPVALLALPSSSFERMLATLKNNCSVKGWPLPGNC